MGELKDVLAPALSSTNRAKSHWRGKTPKSKTPAVDAFACNEVRLLVSCPACQVMHIARRVLAKVTGTGWRRHAAARAGAEGRRAAGGLGAPDDAGDLLGRSTVLVGSLARDTGAALGRPVLGRPVAPGTETGSANTGNAYGRGDGMRPGTAARAAPDDPSPNCCSPAHPAIVVPVKAVPRPQPEGAQTTETAIPGPKTGFVNIPGLMAAFSPASSPVTDSSASCSSPRAAIAASYPGALANNGKVTSSRVTN